MLCSSPDAKLATMISYFPTVIILIELILKFWLVIPPLALDFLITVCGNGILVSFFSLIFMVKLFVVESRSMVLQSFLKLQNSIAGVLAN